MDILNKIKKELLIGYVYIPCDTPTQAIKKVKKYKNIGASLCCTAGSFGYILPKKKKMDMKKIFVDFSNK